MTSLRRLACGAALLASLIPVHAVEGQTVRIRDVTITDGDSPVRLVGYGLIVGLSNTGDRVYGGTQGGMTVRSVANLLRNLGVDVPEQVIRTRNAAAVLVTSEASPYTRRGGRFDVTVASLGDATSLSGGMLWTTPLFTSIGGRPVASAQGTVALPVGDGRWAGTVETSALLADAGVALTDLADPADVAAPSVLLLKTPDLGLAQRIADAVNAELGAGSATVEDPGAVRLALPADGNLGAMAAIGEIEVLPTRVARIVIDARTGAVAAGGAIPVGPAVVSHDWLTVSIFEVGAPALADELVVPGAVRAEAGVQVQELASALHAVGASADIISAVFRSLKTVGALQAEVVVQ